MKRVLYLLLFLLANRYAYSQNIGIGTATPTEKLEVNGNVKATGLILTQGAQYDVAKKGAANALEFSKGNKALGLNYIIAITGLYPEQGAGTFVYDNIILGEIRLFAGNFAPKGFMFCQGQLLSINAHLSLFALLGTTYGGNGSTNFALPDLRGATPVGAGTPAAGAAWTRGEVH